MNLKILVLLITFLFLDTRTAPSPMPTMHGDHLLHRAPHYSNIASGDGRQTENAALTTPKITSPMLTYAKVASHLEPLPNCKELNCKRLTVHSMNALWKPEELTRKTSGQSIACIIFRHASRKTADLNAANRDRRVLLGQIQHGSM